MKKLLLSLGIVSMAATMFAANYTTGTKLTAAPTAETKVIIEGWTQASKGFMTNSPTGASVFSVLDKSDANRTIFTGDYVYTLIPVEGSTTNFYIKNPAGLYAPIATADMNTAGGMAQNGVTDIASAGIYNIVTSPAITTAAYADKYMFANTNQNAGKSHMEVHFNAKDGEFQWCYLQTGDAGMKDAGNSGRTAAALAVYVAEELNADPVNVTVNYPAFGGFQPAPATIQAIPGLAVNAASIPAPEYFTVSGVEGEVAEGATLNVTGTWNFPFQLNQVFRADLRKSASNGCSNWAVVNNQISTRNNDDANAFSPENLFYFKGHGFNEANRLVVTLHTTGLPEEQGYECSAANNAKGAFSANPTLWVVKKNSTGTEGISLQHPDNADAHANDISGILGVWAAAASINDGGSFIRFKALTDSDYASTSWPHNGRTFPLDATLVAAVQAAPTPENVRAVFDAIEEPVMTLTFKHSADDANPATVTLPFPVSITEAPAYPGFTMTESEFVADDHVSATYVMNEGTPFRLFNERTGKYVYVTNGGLYQTPTADESADFLRIPAGEDGAFVLYNPATDTFVGDILGTQKATAAVAFGQMPVKYYTGKQESPIYMDWIGNRSNEEGGMNFFNDFQGNFVCGYTWDDAGSKWIIITNNENFETNWAFRNQLKESKDLYAKALSILGEEDTDNLAEFAANYDFGGDVNLPVSEESQAKIEQIYAKVQEATDKHIANLMDSDELYTIQSASDDRGAIIYDAENDIMTTTGTGVEADANNENHLWGFVKVGGKHYLYNLGAQKFASAYTLSHAENGTATYVWGVSEIPTAITLTTEAFGKQDAIENNRVTIEGGRNNAENRAGMMIINGNEDPYKVPCSLGELGDIKDGTSFIFTPAEASVIVDEMTAKVTEGFNKVNDLITENATVEGWNAEVEGVTVGHYTPEAVEAYTAEITAAKENADKESALYDALDAKAAFESAEKRQIENGHVYTIVDSDDYIHYTDGIEHLSGESMDAAAAYGYWVATVDENGIVSFGHTHENDNAVTPASLYYDSAVVPFAINDVASFIIRPTEELGKMALVDAEDNTPVDDKTYTFKFVSTDAADAMTTHIAEINADTNKAGAVYDLQGRKLVAPVKGINIISGRKILVK